MRVVEDCRRVMACCRKWLLSDNCYGLLLLLFWAYICVGIFPLYCYESDSMNVIFGISVLWEGGWSVPPVHSYEYDMQPMVYYLVAGLRYVLPFVTCEQIYCLLAGIAGLMLIPVSVRFINRVAGVGKSVALFAMFLLPETMAIAMYPNSAILALLPVMVGLNAIVDRRRWLVAVMLSVAPLLRVDVVLMYPVVLAVYIWMGYGFMNALKKSMLLGAVVLVAIVAGFAVLHANPLVASLNKYQYWNNAIPIWRVLVAILSFYGLAYVVLMPVGLYRLIKKRRYNVLLVALVPIVMDHIVYRSMGCAAKHFLYMLPFVSLLGAVAIEWLWAWTRERLWLRYAAAVCLLLLLTVSTRMYSVSSPWRSAEYAEAQCGPVLKFFKESVTPWRVTIGIGAGEVLTTLDEQMLFTGNAFYPLFIHELKLRGLERRDKAVAYIGDKDCDIVNYTWASNADLPMYYTDRGFRCEYDSDSAYTVLTDGSQTIRLYYYGDIITADLANRERCFESFIDDMKRVGGQFYMYNSAGSHIWLSKRQVEKGNLEPVEGTENLFLIKN